ncbi:hypothetical protein [Clostridium sp.]|uniref:hypothetical protein n=1 Tax=Clostridium sp. TaxID=1506 RepID=UPI00260371E0|nr:hypothetical protein [Clostridium sp.]
MIKFIKQLFCKHKYEEIKGSRHIVHGGMDKWEKFKCSKCGVRTHTSIFNKEVNS